ncbi:DUF1707 domain-containing protein [Propioniciclava soli]|uniref:DUF1707 domain-containing protein n=1 Tax=Propioniciclava soli TaxID=2775081 RepID=A0ABZ3CB30_9ACTN
MSTPDSGAIRIGHAEREQAVETLREAAADGRLTLEELDGRIEGALAARTRDDLRPLLADLLPPTDVELVVNTAALQARQRAGEPGWAWQDPLVLTARWDDVVRAGPWEVPPFLELHPVASNVKLNFVDARLTSEIVDVVVHGGAGDAILIVPDGWGADVSRVEKGLGTIKSVVDTRPVGREPLLVVRGKGALGTIKVRHPNRFDDWQRQRRLDKGGGIYAKN